MGRRGDAGGSASRGVAKRKLASIQVERAEHKADFKAIIDPQDKRKRQRPRAKQRRNVRRNREQYGEETAYAGTLSHQRSQKARGAGEARRTRR
jgi:hypothetical protein